MFGKKFRLGKNKDLAFILVFFAGIVATTLAIYLTPLKNLNLIEPRIKDINPVEFYQKFKAHPEKYIFIDVRPQTAYDLEHAEGSISMPLHTLYFERHFLPKRGKTIVLICSGGIASGVGYGYLEHYGFLNLRRIGRFKDDGLLGIEAWKEAGLPTVTGAQKKSGNDLTIVQNKATCPST